MSRRVVGFLVALAALVVGLGVLAPSVSPVQGSASGAPAERVVAPAPEPAAVADAAPAQSREVNVYSSRHYDTDDQIYAAFTGQTGIRVNIIEGGEDQLIERIRNEGANSPADVLVTVDAGRLWRAQQAGILQPISSAVLQERVPASFRDPDGHWFGLTKRARVIMYSTERVNPADLSTYEALADPRWRGKILVRSSGHVYNQSLVGSLIEALGPQATEQWARGIVANFARRPQGADADQLRAVAAGEGDVAITNTYYLARIYKSDDPADRSVAARVAPFFPNQAPGERGAHVNVSGGGVVATARNRDNAIAFLEFLTSDVAQAVFAQGSLEYPIVAGTPLDPVLASFGSFREDELNAARFGANNQQALTIMDRAGWR
jgi:iron(III) transport system substrate-binding protein